MTGALSRGYAQQEAETLHGVFSILCSLRDEIRATAPDADIGGTMQCWAAVIGVVVQALGTATDNLEDAVRLDAEASTKAAA